MAADQALHLEVAYLSGPMSGRPEANFPTFDRAAAQLREMGYMVLTPSEGGPSHEFFENQRVRLGLDDVRFTPVYRAIMRRDIHFVLQADVIFNLPDWRDSWGARTENAVAEIIGVRAVELQDEPEFEWLKFS